MISQFYFHSISRLEFHLSKSKVGWSKPVSKGGCCDASLLCQKGNPISTEITDSIQSITSEPGPDPTKN